MPLACGQFAEEEGGARAALPPHPLSVGCSDCFYGVSLTCIVTFAANHRSGAGWAWFPTSGKCRGWRRAWAGLQPVSPPWYPPNPANSSCDQSQRQCCSVCSSAPCRCWLFSSTSPCALSVFPSRSADKNLGCFSVRFLSSPIKMWAEILWELVIRPKAVRHGWQREGKTPF